MPHRPIIPITISLIIGILAGHYISVNYHGHFALLAIVILISAILIFSPFIYPGTPYFLFIILFFLTGIMFAMEGDENPQLLSLAQNREKVIIEGTVIEPSQLHGDISRIAVRLNEMYSKTGRINAYGKISVHVYSHPLELLPGQNIRFPARLNNFKNFNNPGQYDYRSAMKYRGFSCGATISDGRRIVIMGRDFPGLFTELLEKARGPVRELFKKNLAPQNSALLTALILGERQGIDPPLRELFNNTGLGHILAVSGLHIGLVAWLVFSVSTLISSFSYKLSLSADIRRLSAIVSCLPVILYTIISGFQISGQRAMIMVIVYLFSIILGREKDVWSSLALAALIILGLDPTSIFTASFQLSFIAVTGILWITPFIYDKFPALFNQSREKNLPGHVFLYMMGMAVVTLSATFFLFPVTLFYFNRIPLFFLPANLTVVPLLGLWVIPLGLVSSFCVHIHSSLAEIFAVMAGWGVEIMIAITRFWSLAPWSSLWTVKPNLFEIIIFYSIVFTAFYIRRKNLARIGLFILIGITILDLSYWIYTTRLSMKLRVTYFDVGQGSSALIQFPGHKRMLIDGGGFHRNDFDVGRMVVAPSLWHSKLNKIDYLVLSHPEADHMGGLNFIASNFDPDEFWYNGDYIENDSFKNLINTLETRNVKILLPEDLRKGVEISGVKIIVLHPLNDIGKKSSSPRGRDLNNNSLVVKLVYNGWSFLFPGDIEIPGERIVLQNAGSDLKSDILLAPHHGSKMSCSEDFLNAVMPRICVISSGRDNSFGFPHEETLQRLRKAGSTILRIDQIGAIRISAGKDEIKFKSYSEGAAGRRYKEIGALDIKIK